MEDHPSPASPRVPRQEALGRLAVGELAGALKEKFVSGKKGPKELGCRLPPALDLSRVTP
jgi:hypothetical protein